MRGLSCLYLLKEVMLRIKDLERSMTPPAMSSFDPLPCLDNTNEPVPVDGEGDATEKYLPCHYFGKVILYMHINYLLTLFYRLYGWHKHWGVSTRTLWCLMRS